MIMMILIITASHFNDFDQENDINGLASSNTWSYYLWSYQVRISIENESVTKWVMTMVVPVGLNSCAWL